MAALLPPLPSTPAPRRHCSPSQLRADSTIAPSFSLPSHLCYAPCRNCRPSHLRASSTVALPPPTSPSSSPHHPSPPTATVAFPPLMAFFACDRADDLQAEARAMVCAANTTTPLCDKLPPSLLSAASRSLFSLSPELPHLPLPHRPWLPSPPLCLPHLLRSRPPSPLDLASAGWLAASLRVAHVSLFPRNHRDILFA